uniref:Uncharacterized protein n=1 Tax=Arundo donax TaxID=35708 RepID=A0A0A9H5G6_ARUDO
MVTICPSLDPTVQKINHIDDWGMMFSNVTKTVCTKQAVGWKYS